MKITQAQAISRQEVIVEKAKERVNEEDAYLQQIKGGDFDDDIRAYADPWA